MAEWLALTNFGEFCVAWSGFVAIYGSDVMFRDSFARSWLIGFLGSERVIVLLV